jgi:hypothetical protein
MRALQGDEFQNSPEQNTAARKRRVPNRNAEKFAHASRRFHKSSSSHNIIKPSNKSSIACCSLNKSKEVLIANGLNRVSVAASLASRC